MHLGKMKSSKDFVDECPFKTIIGLGKMNFYGHEAHLTFLVIQGVDKFLSDDKVI